jgi:hypothetical protein
MQTYAVSYKFCISNHAAFGRMPLCYGLAADARGIGRNSKAANSNEKALHMQVSDMKYMGISCASPASSTEATMMNRKEA